MLGCGREEEDGERGEQGREGDNGIGCWGMEEGEEDALVGRIGLEGVSGERDGEVEERGRWELGDSLEWEKGEKADWEGSTEQRYAAGADMVSWLAGREALPRPVALGTLGVRVMVERMVVRGREDEEAAKGEEEEVVEGLRKWAVEERGGAAEEAVVEIGELRLDEEGEDLHMPLAWVWICVWARDWVWF